MSDLFSTTHLNSNLKARSVKGGFVTVGAQGIKFILQTVSVTVLARLLIPADFGLIAMVTAITGFVSMFKDAGLSMATVQQETITHRQVSTLFWINLALTLFLACLIACLAPAIAWFYKEPRLVLITFSFAGIFFVTGLSMQHRALLRRQMQFGKLAVISVLSALVGTFAAIIMAWVFKWEYWALVGQIAVSAIVNTVGDWIVCEWRPSLPSKAEGVRSMLIFGGHLTGANTVNYFARNADDMLIGWYWGAEMLGFYSKAYQLLMMPLQQFKYPIDSVAISALSKLARKPEEYRDFFYKEMRVMLWVIGPGVALLAACAREVVELILGDQWAPAAIVFKILALTALFQPIYSSMMQIFISLGQTNRQLKSSLVTSPLFVVSFLMGLPWGIKGVAISYSVFSLFLILPWILYYTFKGTLLTVQGLWRAISLPVLMSLGIYVTAEGIRSFASEQSICSRLSIVGVSILIFILLITLLSRTMREEAKMFWILLKKIYSR